MRKFWRLPLTLFVVGAAIQSAVLVAWDVVGSVALFRWTILPFSLAWLSADAVLQAVPIRHSHFGLNPLEARIHNVTMVMSFGIQFALIGVAIEFSRRMRHIGRSGGKRRAPDASNLDA